MARNSKNWSTVTINGIAFSKRPTKVGKGKDAQLVGYAQVPLLPSGEADEPFSESDAKVLLTDWLESGVLGYKQTLVATVNALAVQTQAAVRRKFESATKGTHSDDEWFNIGFASVPRSELLKITTENADASVIRNILISRAKALSNAGLSTPEALATFAEHNICTSDNTMMPDVQEQ